MGKDGTLWDQMEAWISRLPGLGTYRNSERRRETDKRVRERLSGRLYQTISHLRGLAEALASAQDLSPLLVVEGLCSRLQQLADTIRYASYGYGGIFDLEKMGEEELRRLYEFDLYLVEDVEIMEQKARGLKPAGERLIEELKELEASCQRIQELFSRRREFICRGI